MSKNWGSEFIFWLFISFVSILVLVSCVAEVEKGNEDPPPVKVDLSD